MATDQTNQTSGDKSNSHANHDRAQKFTGGLDTSKIADTIQSSVSEFGEQAMSSAQDVYKRGETYVNQWVRYGRANPLRTVFALAALWMVVGRLTRRRS